MDTTSLVAVKDQKEKSSLLIEVVNVEKQLWGLISTKGLLNPDVQELYHKICAKYEKILLSDYELVELQDVEYSLWKLHYRHIDEFRKQIKKCSSNEDTAKATIPRTVGTAQRRFGDHKERFKSFLSEATKFYQNMIFKIRKLYGFPEDLNLYRSLNSTSVEPKKMRRFQFLCHRFLVCLGDLARYREQYERPEIKDHNWSLAVTHYLNASKIWPDSGNPQNQLAVLAMYVGDEFLALYHCIRSLAVKEPFPDALNNLILLFERNRSSPLPSLSKDACFNFTQPSSRNYRKNSPLCGDLSNSKATEAENEESNATHLWPLMIRTISLFFIKSSLEDFPCTFASTIAELDDLMTLDDVKLKAALESYRHMGSARSGPFRFLQMVSILIFTIEDLIKSPEVKESKNNHDSKQIVLTQLALTATFIFMGRLVERSLKSCLLETCLVLPALLVFLEWLVSILDEVERYGCDDDKSRSAMSYFFSVFIELLNKFDTNKTEVEHQSSVALWEDFELRGFAPLNPSHASLDFSTHFANADRFENGFKCRAHRIITAAMRLTDRSSKWLLYDKLGRKFSLEESIKLAEEEESERPGLAGSAPEKCTQESAEKLAKIEEEPSDCNEVCKSSGAEDEEVILFKPLTRHNSAPLYSSNASDDRKTPKDTGDETVPADECLRRATSLLIAQNQAHGDLSTLQSDLSNFKWNKPLKHQEYPKKDTTFPPSEPSIPPAIPAFSSSISAGPPSLSGWVLDRGHLTNDSVKAKSDTNKHVLAPIDEVASASFNDLSLYETAPFMSPGSLSSGHNHSPPAYKVPTPSAPLLPDDAGWFNGVQSTYPDYSRANNLFDTAQVGGHSRWIGSHQLPNNGTSVPGLVNVHLPPNQLSSSEWLRQYREKQNLDRATGQTWPVNPYGTGNVGNLHGNVSPMLGLFDQWGTPLQSAGLNYEGILPLHTGFSPFYGVDDQRRDMLFHGYQRPSAFGCGTSNESEPLLRYLKEKEWLLQQDPALRGPAYMGN